MAHRRAETSFFNRSCRLGNRLNILAICASVSLAACSSSDMSGKSAQYKDAVGAYTSKSADPSMMDPVAAAAFWGTRYNRDQQDPQVAVAYSQSLRKIGSVDQAVAIMTKAVGQHGDNADVSLETGKTLVEAGRAFEAVRHLEKAAASKQDDWSALSAYGVALDQIGEHTAARQQYDLALKSAPGSANVLNNKGLSFALEGDLGLAERTLRMAAGSAGGDARIRQNLASCACD